MVDRIIQHPINLQWYIRIDLDLCIQWDGPYPSYAAAKQAIERRTK